MLIVHVYLENGINDEESNTCEDNSEHSLKDGVEFSGDNQHSHDELTEEKVKLFF